MELRIAFGRKKLPYQLYRNLFASEQTEEEKTDFFICKCRAILADIPDRLSEKVQLDMVYGLLHLRIRKRVLREHVTSFTELLNLARSVEDSAMEKTPVKSREIKTSGKRCGYCKKDTHIREECPKLQRRPETRYAPGPSEERKKIYCYGCNAEGVIRSKGPTCSPRSRPDAAVSTIQFSLFTEQCADQRPVVPVKIRGKKGTAILDSGAQRSIAGHQLHQLLKEDGCNFTTETVNVAYADGVRRREPAARTEVEIVLNNRTIPISMLAFPQITTNRTLLGIDFMHKSGLILNSAQKTWCYSDDATNRQPYTIEDVAVNAIVETTAKSVLHLREDEGNELKIAEREQMNSVIDCHNGIFERIGEPTPFAEHRVIFNKEDQEPIAVAPYRMSHAAKTKLRAILDQMLEDDLIEECESAWGAPVALVPKKNGESRMVVDYRALNTVTKKSSYAMPRIDDLLHDAKSTGLMSIIDLHSGYHQVPLREEDLDKCAFTTPGEVTDDLRVVVENDNFVHMATTYLKRLAKDLDEVRERNEKEQDRRKKYADQHRRPTPDYQLGDLVLLKSTFLSDKEKGVTSKFAAKRDDPFLISEQCGPTSYEVADPRRPDVTLGKWHAAALTPFVPGSKTELVPVPVNPQRQRGRPRTTSIQTADD